MKLFSKTIEKIASLLKATSVMHCLTTGSRKPRDKLGGNSSTGIQELDLCTLSQLSPSCGSMTTEDLFSPVATAAGQTYLFLKAG